MRALLKLSRSQHRQDPPLTSGARASVLRSDLVGQSVSQSHPSHGLTGVLAGAAMRHIEALPERSVSPILLILSFLFRACISAIQFSFYGVALTHTTVIISCAGIPGSLALKDSEPRTREIRRHRTELSWSLSARGRRPRRAERVP